MNEHWRRIDLIDVFESIDSIEIPLTNPDCSWDEMHQCFWVKSNTALDTWLRLQGI